MRRRTFRVVPAEHFSGVAEGGGRGEFVVRAASPIAAAMRAVERGAGVRFALRETTAGSSGRLHRYRLVGGNVVRVPTGKMATPPTSLSSDGTVRAEDVLRKFGPSEVEALTAAAYAVEDADDDDDFGRIIDQILVMCARAVANLVNAHISEFELNVRIRMYRQIADSSWSNYMKTNDDDSKRHLAAFVYSKLMSEVVGKKGTKIATAVSAEHAGGIFPGTYMRPSFEKIEDGDD